MVLGALLTEFTTEKVPLFVANLSRGRHYSTNDGKVIVPKPEHTNSSEPIYLTTEELEDPRPALIGHGAP
jgi:hypothetical protein